jgi:hypothetical protein
VYSSEQQGREAPGPHATSEQERKAIVERFKKPDDPLKILIVCDMLLTGFDAPIEQVMYLDSPLKEHTLLQAIARVNRTAANKTYGLVVDYWGVSEALQEALAIFSPSDVQGAMTPKVDELPRLQARHAAAMNFFAGVKNKRDLDRCVLVLEPEDVRATSTSRSGGSRRAWTCCCPTRAPSSTPATSRGSARSARPPAPATAPSRSTSATAARRSASSSTRPSSPTASRSW